MNNPIGDLGRRIGEELRNFFCSDCCVGYTPCRPDSEIHAEKIANELADMIKRVDENTQKSVGKILPYLSKDIDTLFLEIQHINEESFGGKKLNIDLKFIEQKNKEMNRQVKTLVGNMMRERLVLTDPELAVILDEKNDQKRSKNFEAFVRKLREKANAELVKELENIVRKQQESISLEITNRLKEIDHAAKRSDEAFKKTAELKQTNEPALEAEKAKWVYQHGVCDLILNEINNQEAVS